MTLALGALAKLHGVAVRHQWGQELSWVAIGLIDLAEVVEDLLLFSRAQSRPLMRFGRCLRFHSRAHSSLRLLKATLTRCCLLLGCSLSLTLSKQLISGCQSLLLRHLTLWSLSTLLPNLLGDFHNYRWNTSLSSSFLGCKVSLANTLLNFISFRCCLALWTFVSNCVELFVVMDVGWSILFVSLKLFCFLLIFNFDLLSYRLRRHLKLFLRLIGFIGNFLFRNNCFLLLLLLLHVGECVYSLEIFHLVVGDIDSFFAGLSRDVLEVETILLFRFIDAGHDVFNGHAWICLNHNFVLIEVEVSSIEESFQTALETRVRQRFDLR